MVSVAAQPSVDNPAGSLSGPSTASRVDRCIRAIISGTAITNAGTILGTKTPNSPSPTLSPGAVATCSP